ncbi:MAG: hypothetical protein ABSC05_15985 [Candidatus Solibacter sp.]|jgi:hypothetical protein
MVKPAGTQPVLRLTKGQKANKKRMATVAVVFTRSPWVRTPQQVVESLFPTGRRTPGDGPTPPRPENKRVWASCLCLSCRGQPGSRALGPGPHPRILLGDLGQVVKGIRQSITKRALAGAKRKTLEGVADYLYRNRARMRYDEYLPRGWPIASGPVEGACKNLMMERSGMRWTEQMAEAIVQLRAIYLSGDFDCYWQFHIEQDQRRALSRRMERRSKVATPYSFSVATLCLPSSGSSCVGQFCAAYGNHSAR